MVALTFSNGLEKMVFLGMNYLALNAAYSHLEILKWARENGCPWNGDVCANAAREGRLDILNGLELMELLGMKMFVDMLQKEVI